MASCIDIIIWVDISAQHKKMVTKKKISPKKQNSPQVILQTVFNFDSLSPIEKKPSPNFVRIPLRKNNFPPI